LRLLPALAMLLFAAAAAAEVTDSGAQHFELRHEAVSSLPPAALWARLIAPSQWWNPAHSYSGDAANLQLDARAGGLWREDWNGGSVAHGRVLLSMPPSLLRLEAPFGPLQGVGAYVVWSISIDAEGTGSRVQFHEIAAGPPGARLAELAPAVDAVKSEAIRRLVATP
jgi:hypothetical protein